MLGSSDDSRATRVFIVDRRQACGILEELCGRLTGSSAGGHVCSLLQGVGDLAIGCFRTKRDVLRALHFVTDHRREAAMQLSPRRSRGYSRSELRRGADG